MRFDKDGNPATSKTIIIKTLTQQDLWFLKFWREAGYADAEGSCRKAGIDVAHAERLAKRLGAFREEEAKVKALAEIPTPSWVAAKHVENVYEGGGVEDSVHKSLSELAKITGAYKTQAAVSITQNVFNLPKLSDETRARLKEIADREADMVDTEETHERVA